MLRFLELGIFNLKCFHHKIRDPLRPWLHYGPNQTPHNPAKYSLTLTPWEQLLWLTCWQIICCCYSTLTLSSLYLYFLPILKSIVAKILVRTKIKLFRGKNKWRHLSGDKGKGIRGAFHFLSDFPTERSPICISSVLYQPHMFYLLAAIMGKGGKCSEVSLSLFMINHSDFNLSFLDSIACVNSRIHLYSVDQLITSLCIRSFKDC